MMEDWNSEEWQGKRKDQVELSLAIAFLSMLVVGIVAATLVLTNQ
jgi:hypothetical protein